MAMWMKALILLELFGSSTNQRISVRRMKKRVLLSFAALASASLLITLSVCFVNILLLPLNEWVSPTDALFFEGAVSVLVGFLLLLGRGGISFWSKAAAILAAAASAVSGSDTVGPGGDYEEGCVEGEGGSYVWA